MTTFCSNHKVIQSNVQSKSGTDRKMASKYFESL